MIVVVVVYHYHGRNPISDLYPPPELKDVQYLHEKLRVSLLPRDRGGKTAAEVAASLDSSMQTPEWRTIVAYLEQAQAAEELENVAGCLSRAAKNAGK